MGALCMPPPSALPPEPGSMYARTASTPRVPAASAGRANRSGRVPTTRGARAEPARPAQQLAVPIEFVAVLDEGRPEDVPRRASGRHRHRAPVPGVAVIAGMTVRHPPAYVIGQTHVAVVAARQGGHIDRLPTAIVCIGVRPVWVIAGMESPGAIEQSSCGAQRRRIRAAAARQVGDHDGQCHQRRDDDADDQFALCCVDLGISQ